MAYVWKENEMAFGLADTIFYHIHEDDMEEGCQRERQFSPNPDSKEHDDEVFDIDELDPIPEEENEATCRFYEEWDAQEIVNKFRFTRLQMLRLCWAVRSGKFEDDA